MLTITRKPFLNADGDEGHDARFIRYGVDWICFACKTRLVCVCVCVWCARFAPFIDAAARVRKHESTLSCLSAGAKENKCTCTSNLMNKREIGSVRSRFRGRAYAAAAAAAESVFFLIDFDSPQRVPFQMRCIFQALGVEKIQ